MRQLVQEYIRGRFDGLPISVAREKVMEAAGSMVGEGEARSLQAMSRQISTGVQGERSEAEGREAKPSALDTGATGGSLRQATATSQEVGTVSLEGFDPWLPELEDYFNGYGEPDEIWEGRASRNVQTARYVGVANGPGRLEDLRNADIQEGYASSILRRSALIGW